MKKPKTNIFKEFISFINKGSVLDLAVGMIIGSAFTAIVTALVNGILKPLINMIPIGDTGNLQVILKDAEIVDGAVVKEAVIMDFGTIISAIITFICTALVLFIIIKAVNAARTAGDKAKAEADKLIHKDAEKEEAPAVEEAPQTPVETSDDVLKEIRDLLKAQADKKDAE